MQVGDYIFNPRYIRYAELIKNIDDVRTNIIISLTGGETAQYKDQIVFAFDTHKEAEKVLKYIQREMKK